MGDFSVDSESSAVSDAAAQTSAVYPRDVIDWPVIQPYDVIEGEVIEDEASPDAATEMVSEVVPEVLNIPPIDIPAMLDGVDLRVITPDDVASFVAAAKKFVHSGLEFLAGFSAASRDGEVLCHLANAATYFDSGAFQEAVAEYECAVDLDQNLLLSPSVMESYFQAAVSARQLRPAVYAADRIVALGGDVFERRIFDIARVYMHAGFYERAFEYLKACEKQVYMLRTQEERDDMLSELCFLKSECLMKMGMWQDAAMEVSNMPGFGESDRGKISYIDAKFASAWYFYNSWRSEGDERSRRTLMLVIDDVTGSALENASLGPLSVVSPKKMCDFLSATMKIGYEEFVDARGKRGKEKDALAAAKAVGEGASLVVAYLQAITKRNGGADYEVDSSLVDDFYDVTSTDRSYLKQALTDVLSYLLDYAYSNVLTADEENDLYLSVWQAAYSSRILYEQSPEVLVLLSRTLRRSSEGIADRKDAVDALEAYLLEPGVKLESTGDDFLIEIGVAWREYLEALIHFKKDDEAELVKAYASAKRYLELAAREQPENPEVWLNLAWLFYTWGKKDNDFQDSIYFSGAVHSRFEGHKVSATKAVGVSPDVAALIYDARLKPSRRQMGEIKRIYGWSLTKQAKRELDFSRFEPAKAQLLHPALALTHDAEDFAANRREVRDAFYLKSYTQYLMCKAQSENMFETRAPKPSEVGTPITLPGQGEDVVRNCEEAFQTVMNGMFKEELEHDQSEAYYALGLIRAETFNFGSLRKFFMNPLFHCDVSRGSYYAGLLEFVGILYPDIKVRPLEFPGMSIPDAQKEMARIEREQASGFGATEDFLMAFKKGKEENKKRKITRDLLIKALCYQISVGETEASDKYANLFMVMKLVIDNVKESKDPAQVDQLVQYMTKAAEWNLQGENPAAMRRIVSEAMALGQDRLKGVLGRLSS
jgi:tetratricopeptide (TPR) repeat protein